MNIKEQIIFARQRNYDYWAAFDLSDDYNYFLIEKRIAGDSNSGTTECICRKKKGPGRHRLQAWEHPYYEWINADITGNRTGYYIGNVTKLCKKAIMLRWLL